LLAVAGEASGDALLAPVVRRLSDLGVRVEGLGGPLAVAAGLVPTVAYEGLAAHGLTEAVQAVPRTLAALRALRARVPGVDGLLVVDFPEVGLRLAATAHALGRPVAYLAPPQVWAWRSHRAAALVRLDWVGCLFAFEVRRLAELGVTATWVGHPAAATEPLVPPIARGHRAVALLPGSRMPTAPRLARLMVQAMGRYADTHGPVRAHVGCAPSLDPSSLASAIACERADVEVVLHPGARAALAQAEVALVGMGTATLEAALARRPFVGVAKLSPLTEAIARRWVKVARFALPNLVLERDAFPECVGDTATPQGLADALGTLESRRATLLESCDAVRAAVVSPSGPGGFEQAVVQGCAEMFTRVPRFGYGLAR
jgi:lipid-A-disaccharide synthase